MIVHSSGTQITGNEQRDRLICLLLHLSKFVTQVNFIVTSPNSGAAAFLMGLEYFMSRRRASNLELAASLRSRRHWRRLRLRWSLRLRLFSLQRQDRNPPIVLDQRDGWSTNCESETV